MILRINTTSLGAIDALKSFLQTAISLQNAGSAVVDDRTDDEDFISTYGYSKEQLAEGLEALQIALAK